MNRFRDRDRIGDGGGDPNYELVSDGGGGGYGGNSLRLRRVRLRDLGPYVCQAYDPSGGASAVSFEVTAMAHGPVAPASEEERAFLQYVVDHSAPPRGGGGGGQIPYYRTRPPGGIYR